MFDVKKGETHKKYFTQVVCEGNMEGPPNPRTGKQEIGNPKLKMACFCGKDRFKVNFVGSLLLKMLTLKCLFTAASTLASLSTLQLGQRWHF